MSVLPRLAVSTWAAAGFGLFVIPAFAQTSLTETMQQDASQRAQPREARLLDGLLPAIKNQQASADAQALRLAVLEWARSGYQRIDSQIADYTCLLVKRERVHGKLLPYHYMFAKVRHGQQRDGQQVPFSVYLKFLAPDDLQGREVLYVEGQNDGKLIAKKGGLRFAYITTRIDPNSELALEDNRYPITEFGFKNLVRRFIEHLENSVLEDCTLEIRTGASVDGRPCIGIEVINHRPDSAVRFHSARVYIDTQLEIPIHYEAFDWPAAGQTEPRLLEQYTYRQIKLNVGLTDADFDPANPDYGFRK
ncbi:MAG: hypothetical protein KatS3mg110_4610 [Pirellulaceae bacterium]|nr:MAG: hypothetical protein KatS3mg110_4610 [Pirellulaceae bacterium]